MKNLYLIDASGYLFRAYFALPALSNSRGQATHAVYGFVRSLLRLMKDFRPTHMAAVFDASGGKESRQKIYKEYKAHRPSAPEDLPQQIAWAAEFCELWGIPIVAIPGVEADDAIGTITKAVSKERAHVYVCTSDKDLYQLVGNHVSVVNTFRDNLVIDAPKVEELLGVKPSQVADLLALMGDASDNIPGVPGIGIKTAAALLQEFGTLEKILAHPEKVKGKKRQETLVAEADTARLSKQLAVLHEVEDCPTQESDFVLRPPDVAGLRAFFHDMEFSSLLKELPAVAEVPSVAESPVAYHIVDDEAGVVSLVNRLAAAEEVCVDVETSDLRPAQARLVGIGLGAKEGEAWYIPTNGNLGLDRVIQTVGPLFANSRIRFFGHNLKYDLHVLANHGIMPRTIGFDTIVASYLLNSHSRSHSLDALSLHYFDKVKTPIKSLIGTGRQEISMAQVAIDRVGPYCCEDVDYTIRLKNLLEPELERRKLTSLMQNLEMPLLLVLLKMERTGIYIDVPYLKQLSSVFGREIEGVAEEICQMAGEKFNLGSPKQLAHILFEKLKIKPLKKIATGYSTDAEVLEQLAYDYPIAQKILQYRTLDKLRSTYVETLPNQVDAQTGRVHTTFVQYVAATGRLASQDPNLQNIPVRSEEGRQIRQAFRPAQEDWLFLSADYSQVELRLLAHFSQDENLLRAFEKGEDIHAHTASRVFEVPLNQVTKAQRHQAKAVNFGIIYGQQAWGLARELGIEPKEAAKFIDSYFKNYPKVREYVDYAKDRARVTGKASTILGRERAIPEITSRNAVQRSAAERLAINAPLQGSAADLIKLAMIRVDKALTAFGLRSRLLLQIHDELLFEGPKEEMEALSTFVREAMEGALELSVKLPVDISVGKNWEEC
jgi:DNA polymerase I